MPDMGKRQKARRDMSEDGATTDPMRKERKPAVHGLYSAWLLSDHFAAMDFRVPSAEF